MPDRTMKKGDTWPPLRATLTANGSPLDLTDADTIRVVMRTSGTVVTGICQPLDQTTNPGRVEYVWVTGDTTTPGTYGVEFEINWGPGQDETIPNSGVREIVIEEDLQL